MERTEPAQKYRIDSQGFLVNPLEWDEDFAREMALKVGITEELTVMHWKVIQFIREHFFREGLCPLIYQTCRANGLMLQQLKRLFPTGYLRGACKLAGLTYRDGYLPHSWLEANRFESRRDVAEKTYHVNARGFLVEPSEWDQDYALNMAFQLKMPDGLANSHWRVIRYLRDRYAESGSVPTVYETCEALKLEPEELEKLFPDGYHRGAVKLAGLRVL